MQFLSLIALVFVMSVGFVLSGCSSPPEPPQPRGERVLINPISKIQQQEPQKVMVVNDLQQ